MKNLAYVLPFVALTFFCWGIYGPVLHVGQKWMADSEGLSTLRPLICVGIAYFLIAVVFPLVVLWTKGESGGWTFSGTLWSVYAGIIGAVGALGVVLAFKFRGDPVYVMPLVFGCAPVVNTVVTMFMNNSFQEATKRFYIAILVVAVGAAGVMAFKPSSEKAAMAVTTDQGSKIVPITINGEPYIRETRMETTLVSDPDGQPILGPDGQAKTTEKPFISEYELQSVKGADLMRQYRSSTAPNLILVALSIGLTAACWGSYGPILHRGQMRMKGSKLRPFLCVGWAYFGIAVIFPLILLPVFPEKGAFDWQHIGGISWSLFAGVAGAVGALGVIYAFNFGGKPIFVMPLVFGLAPVVNTFTTIVSEGLYGQVSTMFFTCLFIVIIGSVFVLIFAPRPASKPDEVRNENGNKDQIKEEKE